MTETPVRLIGIDFGDRRTGVAVTDPTGTVVTPLDAIPGNRDSVVAKAIVELARERDTQLIVVGLPLAGSGQVGHRAERTLKFVTALEQVAPCPVTTVDESFSTDEAHRRLQGMSPSRRKGVADSVAAMVILERYRGL